MSNLGPAIVVLVWAVFIFLGFCLCKTAGDADDRLRRAFDEAFPRDEEERELLELSHRRPL